MKPAGVYRGEFGSSDPILYARPTLKKGLLIGIRDTEDGEKSQRGDSLTLTGVNDTDCQAIEAGDRTPLQKYLVPTDNPGEYDVQNCQAWMDNRKPLDRVLEVVPFVVRQAVDQTAV